MQNKWNIEISKYHVWYPRVCISCFMSVLEFNCFFMSAKHRCVWMTSELLLWHLTWHGLPQRWWGLDQEHNLWKRIGWLANHQLIGFAMLLVRLAGLRLGGKSTSVWFVQDQVQPNQITWGETYWLTMSFHVLENLYWIYIQAPCRRSAPPKPFSAAPAGALFFQIFKRGYVYCRQTNLKLRIQTSKTCFQGRITKCIQTTRVQLYIKHCKVIHM